MYRTGVFRVNGQILLKDYKEDEPHINQLLKSLELRGEYWEKRLEHQKIYFTLINNVKVVWERFGENEYDDKGSILFKGEKLSQIKFKGDDYNSFQRLINSMEAYEELELEKKALVIAQRRKSG